ncbi:MAG: hypothetical protein AABW41_04705 [Nanoarchaeota archaeon]
MLKYVFIVLLLFAQTSLGASINIERNNYSIWETVQGNINLYGSDKELVLSDISLLDNNSEKINIAISLIKIDKNNNFFYFDANKNFKEGNYSLIVYKVPLFENGILVEKNITAEFSVQDSNYSVSIDPGILYVEDVNEKNSYVVSLKNNMNPLPIKITSENFAKLSSYEINMQTNNSYTLQILLDKKYDYSYGFNGHVLVHYADRIYRIPIYIKNAPLVKQQTPILKSINEKLSINLIISGNQSIEGPLYFKNSGQVAINNVIASLDGNLDEILDIGKRSFSLLAVNESIEISLSINGAKNKSSGQFNGSIILNYDSNVLKYPIFIHVKDDALNTTQENNASSQNNTTSVTETENKKRKFNYIILFFAIAACLLLIFFLLKKKRKKPSEENKFDEIISKHLRK